MGGMGNAFSCSKPAFTRASYISFGSLSASAHTLMNSVLCGFFDWNWTRTLSRFMLVVILRQGFVALLAVVVALFIRRVLFVVAEAVAATIRTVACLGHVAVLLLGIRFRLGEAAFAKVD